MQAYTELLPPTAVTHALSVPFTSKKAQNLIVVKTSLLQIFRVKKIRQRSSTIQDEAKSPVLARTTTKDNNNAADRVHHKLVLVAEYALSGTVTSIASIKTMENKSRGQALLVSFLDAKISLIEWDPDIYSISTISIHYYETEDLQGAPWAPELGQCRSYLTVDPSSRCAAFKFGQRHLAILPFRQPGDDLAMGEYDAGADAASVAKLNGQAKAPETPYAASFVLPLTALDPTLINTIDLAFLHEYREPTLGILSSAKAPALSLLQERKDPLTYTVFTLDLEQRARTPLLSVSGLPADLFRLVSLPLPVGGTLLVGANELIHVDQSGKTTAVAVNEFAREMSAFAMADQSELELRLEHCQVQQIDKSSGDVLLLLESGEMLILSFVLDGRSVNSLVLNRIGPEKGGNVCKGGASCVTSLEDSLLFVGGNDADALLLSCERENGSGLAKKRSHAEMLGLDPDDEEDDEDLEDEDDLYGGATVVVKAAADSSMKGEGACDVRVRIEDKLINLSARGAPAFSPSSARQSTSEYMAPGIDIIIPTGSGNAGSLVFATKSLKPEISREHEVNDVRDAWSLQVTPTKTGDGSYVDNILLVSQRLDDGTETSSVYALIGDGSLQQKTGTDFEGTISTLNAGVLGKGTRLVQVTQSEVRCYDADLGLAQIIPMLDEETDEELKVKFSQLCDPYLLVIRDDLSAMVIRIDAKGELEDLDRGEAIINSEWISGCIHRPASSEKECLLYLLNSKGSINVFALPDLTTPVYVTDLRNLPTTLTGNGQAKRVGSEQAAPVEVLVCELGDDYDTSTYMIIRADDDELALYEPYNYPPITKSQPFITDLRWRKVAAIQPSAPAVELIDGEAAAAQPLRILNLDGRSTVLMHRGSSTLLVKEAGSVARAYTVEDKAMHVLNSMRLGGDQSGMMSVNAQGKVIVSRLSNSTNYGTTGWAIRQLSIDQGVEHVCYHPESSSYIIATSTKGSFALPDDEWHPEWSEEKTTFRPQVDQGTLKIIDAANQKIQHEVIFSPEETVLCMKLIDLDISEYTHERKSLIVVGTGKLQGEDYTCGGSIYVFDVVQVVPDPDKPEFNRVLKMIAREELRGPVTALAECGEDGFLVHAQGQKIMVRGLKEDNSLLPVAFLDVQCLVTSLKNVRGTGLVLVADAMKGVWLTGYSDEPYALRLFGKSRSKMEVLTAELLPVDKQLFIVVADADCNIHVLEFNPEDPKSLGGHSLLHRSTFHTGHFPGSMTLLPSSTTPTPNTTSSDDSDPSEDAAAALPPSASILLTSPSGALSLLTPLPEATYRRLFALQTHLITILDHPCGLNPRAYRAVESEGFGGRGVLDGSLLRRWTELSSQKKIEACKRIGEEIETVRGWLNLLGGGALGYL